MRNARTLSSDHQLRDLLAPLRGPAPDDLDDVLENIIAKVPAEKLIALAGNTQESIDLRAAMARAMLLIDVQTQMNYRIVIVEALQGMLRDQAPGLRIAAMDSISALKLSDEDTVMLLRNLSRDSNPMVSRNAKNTLVKLRV